MNGTDMGEFGNEIKKIKIFNHFVAQRALEELDGALLPTVHLHDTNCA